MATRRKNETLRELVTRLLAEHDMSGREFARRAEAKGIPTSYNTINEIANGRRINVTLDTLEAISIVFGIDENAVRAAAGVAPRDESTDPELLALHGTLTPDEKRQALAVYRQYVNGLKALRTPK